MVFIITVRCIVLSEKEYGEIIYAYNSYKSGVLDIYLAGTINPRSDYSKTHMMEKSYFLAYLTSGHISVECAGTTFSVSPGELIFIHKNTLCRFDVKQDSGSSGYWGMFAGALPDALVSVYSLPAVCVRRADAFDTITNMHKILEEVRIETYLRDMNNASRLLFNLILDLNEAGEVSVITDRNRAAEKIRLYIDNNIYNDISLDDVSAHFAMTNMHIIRLFRDAYGVTPMQYAIKRRNDIAETLLSLTDLSIHTISDMLHYSNTQHFSNSFKKLAGVSPNKFLLDLNNASNGDAPV